MRKSFLLGVGVLFIVFLSSSCVEGPNISNSTPELNTVAPMLFPTDTPTPCTQTVDNASENVILSPRLIYFIIDKSGSFMFAEGIDYTKRSISFIQEVLKTTGSLRPGDKIYIMWLDGGEDSFLLKGYIIPSLASPIAPTLIPTPLCTPTIVPPLCTLTLAAGESTSTSKSRMDEMRESAQRAAQYQRCIQTATEVHFKNAQMHADCYAIQQEARCRNLQSIEAYYKELREWEMLQNEEVEKAAQEIIAVLESAKQSIKSTRYTPLREALFYAERILAYEREENDFKNLKLIVLSDLKDAGSQSPDKYDFSNVDVFLGMVPCNNALECEQKRTEWEELFRDWNVQYIEFRSAQEITVEMVINFLNK